MNDKSLDFVANFVALSYAAFERDAEQFLGFYCKFHWEFCHHLFGVAVHDESHGIFGADATLVAIEDLFLVDFAGGGFMLHYR